MMNGEETDGGISLGDMEKALVCLLMNSMEAFHWACRLPSHSWLSAQGG